MWCGAHSPHLSPIPVLSAHQSSGSRLVRHQCALPSTVFWFILAAHTPSIYMVSLSPSKSMVLHLENLESWFGSLQLDEGGTGEGSSKRHRTSPMLVPLARVSSERSLGQAGGASWGHLKGWAVSSWVYMYRRGPGGLAVLFPETLPCHLPAPHLKGYCALLCSP